MAVCKSLFILSLRGKIVPFIRCTLFTYLHTVMLREILCNMMRKMRGLHGRTEVFSALTEDKRFSNANCPQRRVKQKAHVYKHVTIYLLLRVTKACVYSSMCKCCNICKAHIFTAHADKIPVQLSSGEASPATTRSTKPPWKDFEGKSRFVTSSDNITSLYTDWAKILKEECLINNSLGNSRQCQEPILNHSHTIRVKF